MQHAATYNLPASFTASASRRSQASTTHPCAAGWTLCDGRSQAFVV